ncbi:MAG TPA: hypothetical protein ENG63_04970 [Candidatus Desulfofervidus auxilii]|uniref:Tyr recombinase domain-containing protein n=1 Tax=Desulfofervidus auxilii TaxID=1621989 RepID=A0A7C0U2U4_DESA2|nr:hypothetical protein [Candidatus Desulfofervidus auxilii]
MANLADLESKIKTILFWQQQNLASSTFASKKSIINDYLKYIQKNQLEIDKFSVMSYLSDYQKTHKKYSTYVVLKHLRKFLKDLEIDNNIQSIRVSIDDIDMHAMPDEDVIKLIHAKYSYEPYLRGVICLATTYGLRRIEIQKIKKSDIDLKNKKIFIDTAKRGVKRWMLIPDEIIGVLADFKEDIKQVSVTDLSFLFHKACYLADIKTKKWYGYHAIRRALINNLTLSGLDDFTIAKFFRWRKSYSAYSPVTFEILNRYRQSMDNEDIIKEIDQKVFKIHPFIKEWL